MNNTLLILRYPGSAQLRQGCAKFERRFGVAASVDGKIPNGISLRTSGEKKFRKRINKHLVKNFLLKTLKKTSNPLVLSARVSDEV
jgi:hypothetical protein